MEPNWWARPGKVVWRGHLDFDNWTVRFIWDDGSTWGLEWAPDFNAAGASLEWDYQAHSLAVPGGRDLPLQSELVSHLSAISPLRPDSLGVKQRAVVQTIAGQFSQRQWATTKRLRAATQASDAELPKILTRLVPQYVYRLESGAAYSLTFAGLLASPLAEHTRAVVEASLTVIARRFLDDPDFDSYSWDELRAVGGWSDDERDLVWNLLNATRMFDGGSGGANFRCNAPHDVADLASCGDWAAYLSYLRRGTSGRSWPTAAACLPEERDERKFQPVTVNASPPSPAKGPSGPSAAGQRFTDLCEIGAGDFGEVYRAWDTKLRRHVALKFVPLPHSNADALAHARTLAGLEHDKIVRVFDVDDGMVQPGTDMPADVVIMELIDGRSLAALVEGDDQLQPSHATKAASNILDAMAHIRGKGVFHGDLHRGNVMVTRDGAKLIDLAHTALMTHSTASLVERQRADLDACARLVADVLSLGGLNELDFLQACPTRALSEQVAALDPISVRASQGGEIEARGSGGAELVIADKLLKKYVNESGHCYRHDYELRAVLRNASTRTIDRWHIEIEVPHPLRSPNVSHALEVRSRETASTFLLRKTSETEGERTLYPLDEAVLPLEFFIDDDRYHRGQEFLGLRVVVRAFVDDEALEPLVVTVEERTRF